MKLLLKGFSDSVKLIEVYVSWLRLSGPDVVTKLEMLFCEVKDFLSNRIDLLEFDRLSGTCFAVQLEKMEDIKGLDKVTGLVVVSEETVSIL